MQDVGQSEALAKQSVKCEKRAFSCEKYGLDLDRKDFVNFDQRFTRPAEVDILLGDGSKAHDELGWMPEVDFKGLVKMMVEHDFDLAYREKRALES